MPSVLILVGLGNPGAKYAGHRHNVGFMAVDAIAGAHGFSAPRRKFQGEFRDGFLDTADGRCKTVILKPQTYMNESGQAVGEAMRFFKAAPRDIVVFYDELDLAPGKLRVKTGGGAAGHNGIRSIISHIGPDFRRARIGIGHPGDKTQVTGHVLGDFAKVDKEWLDPLLAAIAAAAPNLVSSDAKFTSDIARRLAPPKPAQSTPARDSTRHETAAGSPGHEKQKPGALGEALQKLFGKKD